MSLFHLRDKFRRFDRIVLVVIALMFVAVVVAAESGCFKRWPIVIVKGGSGTGEAQVAK